MPMADLRDTLLFPGVVLILSKQKNTKSRYDFDLESRYAIYTERGLEE